MGARVTILNNLAIPAFNGITMVFDVIQLGFPFEHFHNFAYALNSNEA